MDRRFDASGSAPSEFRAGAPIVVPALTQGVVLIHSSPAAVCPHVEWAVSSVLETRADLGWIAQPAAPGHMRAELTWVGSPGSGARLASNLRQCAVIRFEVTEDATATTDGERYAWTPSLGMFSAAMGRAGDVLISELRLRTAMAGEADLVREVHRLLGTAWDDELEAFRSAGEGAPVRWLHQATG